MAGKGTSTEDNIARLREAVAFTQKSRRRTPCIAIFAQTILPIMFDISDAENARNVCVLT